MVAEDVLNFEIYFPQKNVFRGFLSSGNLIVEWSGVELVYSLLNLIHFHMNTLMFPWEIEEILIII